MRSLRKIHSENRLNINEMNINDKSLDFHETIRFALIMAQCFGIMPLHNLGKNGQDVNFKFLSWRLFFAILHIACVSSFAVACVVRAAVQGFLIDQAATTSFYIFNTITSIHFVYLAMKWDRLLMEYAPEHILFIVTHLYHSLACENFHLHPAEIYFGCAFPEWFTLIGYSHWTAALAEFSNIISTFTWNFIDLFIILISISLREKFNLISRRIKQNQSPPNKFWKEIREDYFRVSYLTRVVDKQIAGLVLISFLNNIFFLCIQLYNSIKEREALIDSIYFFYSFGFVVFRVVAVSLYSATLNEAASKPLKHLYSLPTQCYTIDVSRLITQINYLPNGITGHGFFLITKNFLLQAAATVVTFELMIFQFSPVKTEPTQNYSNISLCFLLRFLESVIQVIYFFYLAYSWKTIVQYWKIVEAVMRHYEGPHMNLKGTLRKVMAFFIMVFLVEYPILSIIHNKRYGTAINTHENDNIFLKITFHIATIQRVFIWFYRDVLLIMISMCLVVRLKQIQEKISFLNKLRIDNVQIWRSTREDYVKLIHLCRIINKKISWLIIISYFANVEFLLDEGFFIIATSQSFTVFERTAHFYTISTTIFKIVLVSFYGSLPNNENDKIIDLLLSVQSDIFNKETERFLNHAASGEMMLRGSKYFNITRGLILKVASVLVTYLLVIMQLVENFEHIE
ncbi:unnamed protein product [Ceutorhynchus assimilis]|uniref:Gustatory receptor n=1 Tax=Ceutorhynchus assimilis TaxID=467358 RepID=A0A9N9QPQ6_9CUCU|nr:unnamed protein product [Ceutorhynchus assimilis]